MHRLNLYVPERRNFLRSSAILTIAGTLSSAGLLASLDAWSQTADAKPVDGVKELLFDVFGTLVDWRTGVAREAAAILKPLGYSLDWIAFADAWRAEYQSGMEEVRSGAVPFSKLDVIHRRMLERIRTRFGLEKLDEPVLQALNLAWHRLDAWKDVPAGLHRLRRRFLLAPCSNGNISLMVDLARRNDFRWDAVLGAEVAGDYKPKPRVYLVAAEAFNLAPDQCMMVAAHSGDLKAAASVGMHTAHLVRADEFGLNTGEPSPRVPVDLAVRSLDELADAYAI
ncbi:MAG: haloacid dehalogenase type II [Pseudomonadota bacterium]|nr:haloacid dehalogenase type II [Pseudomonadota bacterium]